MLRLSRNCKLKTDGTHPELPNEDHTKQARTDSVRVVIEHVRLALDLMADGGAPLVA